jgi:hypothetical protein
VDSEDLSRDPGGAGQCVTKCDTREDRRGNAYPTFGGSNPRKDRCFVMGAGWTPVLTRHQRNELRRRYRRARANGCSVDTARWEAARRVRRWSTDPMNRRRDHPRLFAPTSVPCATPTRRGSKTSHPRPWQAGDGMELGDVTATIRPQSTDNRAGVVAPTKGIYLEAVADWFRVTGEHLPPRVRAVVDGLVNLAFERNGHQVERGVVELWYSDVEAVTGYGPNAVGRAMRWLQGTGWLDGAPNPADPANDWYRERAVYRLTIPAILRRVRNRVRWNADKAAERDRRLAAAELRAADAAAQLAANVAAGANTARQYDRSQSVGPRAVFKTRVHDQGNGTAEPVEIRPLPPDYAAARDRLLARTGGP